ncbi:MAG: chloride channel protein [Acidobacteriota bacterium]
MFEHRSESSSTTPGLPVDLALGPALDSVRVPHRPALADRRVVWLSLIASAIGLAAGGAALVLSRLIALITNLAFYGRLSLGAVSPADNALGPVVFLVPVVGGLVVGVMARYGSAAIRGHGIPEAMEQVLLNESRIPPRITLLKPLSAAISIGTGGPFGAEGPIIATGGALGSVIAQALPSTAHERKTLLAAGAAAGMAATFGCPVAAVLLAVELLLFEYRRRSIVPVALASAAAAGVRALALGTAPVFAMPEIAQPGGVALLLYVLLGALVGVASVGVTRAVYGVEDWFERLPVHWMWWPALGAVAVGAIGWLSPHTLGVGYDNIEATLTGSLAGKALLAFAALKFVSWVIALGSGTSGGTLAPLFTIGGGLGAVATELAATALPAAGLDARIGALVGMAAMFAGASNAFLTSVVFAFETTRQPIGLLPLLAGCAAAFLVASLCARSSIMTEKLERRGVRVPSDYAADELDQVRVGDCCARPAVTLHASATLGEVRTWLESGQAASTHQGFPLVDDQGLLVAVLTRRTLLDPRHAASSRLADLALRPPLVTFADSSLRDAVETMVDADVGRLPVVERGAPGRVVGMLTRSDVLAAHRHRMAEFRQRGASLGFGRPPRSAAAVPAERDASAVS